MISPLLDPSRKPLNALRGLRRKTAHFIPSAGVHTKGSYNSTTTAFCAQAPDYAACTRYSTGRPATDSVTLGRSSVHHPLVGRGRQTRACFTVKVVLQAAFGMAVSVHTGGYP